MTGFVASKKVSKLKIEYDFARYLSAKKTVDDRALNKDVWAQLRRHLPDSPAILEVGAGIGTMVERLVDGGLANSGHITAIDNQSANIAAARGRLRYLPPDLSLELETIDLFDFIARESRGQEREWDVLIAHAFLDLMDVELTLPLLLGLLKRGGLCYFTINFDGVTTLEPAIDPAFDGLVERLYHETMDARVVNGRLSGDSRSGRHLFALLRQNGVEIIAAGSSDWVVYAGAEGYVADEAYFLHFIVHTMHGALRGHPQLDAARFEAWIAARHAQIERGELVYITHQMDFLGRTPPVSSF